MSQNEDIGSAGESEYAGFELLRKCHPPITGILGAAMEILPGREVNTVECSSARVHVKLPRYDGSVPPELYFAQVQLPAWRAGWSKEDSVAQLALALEGPALQVLLDLTPAEQRDYETLMEALQQRFGVRQTAEQRQEQLAGRWRKEGESLGALAADVRFYVRRGYPQCAAAGQEELALHAFLQALLPEKLRQHVHLSAP